MKPYDVNDHLAAADAVRDRLNARLAQPGLSHREVAALWTAAKRELDQLAEAHEVAVAEERGRRLQDAVAPRIPPWTPPQEKQQLLDSYRDALARAAAVEDDRDGEELLRRAAAADDKLLVRACGVVAAERGWGQTAKVHREADPDHAERIAAAAEQFNSPKERFRMAMAFTEPAKPQVIADLSEVQIGMVADGVSSQPRPQEHGGVC